MQKNNPEERLAKYRKYQNNLMVGGSAIAFFGVWSVLKGILTYLFDRDDIFELFETVGIEVEFENAALIISLVILIIDMMLRIKTSMLAREIANKPKVSVTCFLLLGLFIFVSLVSLNEYISGNTYYISKADRYISIVLECTITYNLCEVLYSYIRLLIADRKLHPNKPEGHSC